MSEGVEGTEAMLEAFRAREERLVLREAQLDDRLQALAVAEAEISEKLAALTEAEASCGRFWRWPRLRRRTIWPN